MTTLLNTWSLRAGRDALVAAVTAGRPAPWWVLAVAACCAALIAAMPLINLGAYVCDEFHQFLEPAWRMASGGNSWIAWEWKPEHGLRNPFAPGFLAGIIWFCHAVGILDPWWIRVVMALPIGCLWMLIFCRAAAWLPAESYRPVRHVVGILVITGLPAIFYVGGRTLSETCSGCIYLLLLTALPERGKATRWHAAFLGAGVALVGVLRYGSLPLALGLIPIFAWRLGLHRSLIACCAALMVSVGLGLADLVMWGSWWHSFWAYLAYNRSEQSGKDFGFVPFSVYLPVICGLPFLAIWACRFWRHPLVLAIVPGVIFYVALLANANYKDTRFFIPVFMALVPLCMLAIGSLRGNLLPIIIVVSSTMTLVTTTLAYQRMQISGEQVAAALEVYRQGKVAAITTQPCPPFYPGAFWQHGAATIYTSRPDSSSMVVLPPPPDREVVPLPVAMEGVKFP